MLTVDSLCRFLDRFAPPALAESWDNVGLLVGDRDSPLARVMTCLTITPQSAAEAIAQGAELIVSHHPLPFRELKRLTRESVEGALLLDLIAAGVAVYSPHTAFDSAARGINRRLADGLGLIDVAPLLPCDQLASDDAEPVANDAEPVANNEAVGTGRWGRLPAACTLEQLAEQLKGFLNIDGLHVVGSAVQSIHTVAVGCGSAGELLGVARRAGCDALVLGETRFHTCLEAEAAGVALLLAGHYASERFAVEHLADVLNEQFPELHVWASRQERDPLRWI